jgi:hypothetical protein
MAAGVMAGSEGRIGILIAVTLLGFVPKEIPLPEDGSASMNLASAGRAALTREDARGFFDPRTVFSW